MKTLHPTRLPHDSGIAIGPILFVIAIMGAVAAMIAASSGSGMGTAIRADQITPVLTAQADLIRSKFQECYLIRDAYPVGDGTGTNVRNEECDGDPSGQRNLWTGTRPVMLGPPPTGFDEWKYFDYSGSNGGRCIMIKPTTTNTAAVLGVKQGILKASEKYSSQEVDYASGGTNQKLIIWISRPSSSAGANCVSN
ncbi:MAG: hypothetical protein EBZ69_02495 [Alphaproteobacteria bacterium]|nr:hypothetical protein [Alphaproteobacteria bacterium]